MADTYSTIGPFVLFKETEADDLGRLYRAGEVDKEGWRRTVWLRVFQAPGIDPEAFEERVALVNELSGQLKAANVVSGQALAVIDGIPVLAWDHVPGHLLSRLLAKTREEGFPVPIDNALLIIEKVALALAAGLSFELEGQSLIHGFLHPSMILVSNEGEAMVSGFGLADQLLGVLDDPAARERCAPYLAPEVLQARSTTKRGDVYSLGAILFELLTGGPLPADPAARPEAVENARMALEDEPVPDDIAVLLKRSLAARPEERFSSAADFKKELDKLLFGGNYSPTTFNLALFIDRLFRADIEQEEKERLAEQAVDPAPYLAPEPEESEETELAVAKARSRAGMWIALAAALVLVAVALVILAPRLRQPAVPPTPTPEELARQKEAEKKRFEALVQEELQRLIAEREAQTKKELEQRQKEIEQLKKKLKTVQKPQGQRTMTEEQKRQEAAIREQLAKAEAAKKAQEAELEKARQKALEEARRKAEAKAAEVQKKPTPAPKAAPTEAPAPAPTAPPKVAAAPSPTPKPKPTAAPPAGGEVVQVTEGMYIPPTDVDTTPAVLRTETPRWTRMAQNSRRRGVVILSARVNAKGRVTAVKILRADDKGFGIPQSAADAVRKYLFKPGTKNGVKITTDATVAIPYSFRGR